MYRTNHDDELTAKIKKLAREALDQLTSDKRDDGTTFYTWKGNNYDSWYHDMAHKAHGDMFPDDYKYEFIRDSLYIIEEASDLDDVTQDIDSQVDVYNYQLIKWLASHGERAGYVEEATAELGHSKDMGLMGDLMAGQFMERQEVYSRVKNYLEERAEELDDDEAEEETDDDSDDDAPEDIETLRDEATNPL